MSYLPPLRDPVRTIGRRTFDFDHEIVVMGIVNRTPDSFFDQGRTYALDDAVAAALDADAAGAGWIDVGGVPFSSDAQAVTLAEEIDRVVPVVEKIAAQSDRRYLPSRGRCPWHRSRSLGDQRHQRTA